MISQQLQSAKAQRSANATEEKVRLATPEIDKTSASKASHYQDAPGAFSAREEKLHPFYKNLRSNAAVKGVASSSVAGVSASQLTGSQEPPLLKLQHTFTAGEDPAYRELRWTTEGPP